MRYLTKSAFKEALSCPARLTYYKNARYANQDATNEFLEALAEGGFQVGELAKVYFGVDESNDLSDTLSIEAALLRTEELLRQERCVIAEAAFRFGDCLIRADILRKEGQRIELIEVKAKSWDPTHDVFAKVDRKSGKYKVSSDILPYVYDVAFQKYVLRGSLVASFPNKTFDIHVALMMADKSKVADVDGINQCFRIKRSGGRTYAVRQAAPSGLDVGKLNGHVHIVNPFFEVDPVCDLIIAGETAEQDSVLRGMKFVPFVNDMARRFVAAEEVTCSLSTACFQCSYFSTEKNPGEDGFKRCWRREGGLEEDDFERPLLGELWGGGNTRLRGRLLSEGKLRLSDVQIDDLGSTEKKSSGLTHVERKIVQLALATHRPELLGGLSRNVREGVYLDIQGLREAMSSWKFPLHMIDFETSAVALPFYKGLRPYEQIAFQYSHHVIDRLPDGSHSIRHAGQFINVEKGKFPNFDFLRALKKELEPDSGSIFRYSNHENTILCAIRDQLEVGNEPDKAELMAFIDSVTHRSVKLDDGSLMRIAGPRDMIDLCEVVKAYFYHPLMKGSNSIKAVLPAVLNSSEFLRKKYAEPIYGSEIRSLNISPDAPIPWISQGEDGVVSNPYKKLPPVGAYFPEGCDIAIAAQEESLEEVNNGGAALAAYGLLQFSDDVKTQALKNALLRYCELDTMAMVFVWEYFRDRVENA